VRRSYAVLSSTRSDVCRRLRDLALKTKNGYQEKTGLVKFRQQGSQNARWYKTSRLPVVNCGVHWCGNLSADQPGCEHISMRSTVSMASAVAMLFAAVGQPYLAPAIVRTAALPPRVGGFPDGPLLRLRSGVRHQQPFPGALWYRWRAAVSDWVSLKFIDLFAKK